MFPAPDQAASWLMFGPLAKVHSSTQLPLETAIFAGVYQICIA